MKIDNISFSDTIKEKLNITNDDITKTIKQLSSSYITIYDNYIIITNMKHVVILQEFIKLVDFNNYKPEDSISITIDSNVYNCRYIARAGADNIINTITFDTFI